MKADRIREITFVARTEGFDKTRGELKGLTEEQRALAAGADAMAVSTDKSARAQISAAAKYERQTAQLNEQVRAQQKIAKEMKIAQTMRAQEGITDAQLLERGDLITKMYDRQSNFQSRFLKDQQKANQERINAIQGIRDVSTFKSAAESASVFTKELGSLEDQQKRNQEQFNKLLGITDKTNFKSAAESASVFTKELGSLADEQKRNQEQFNKLLGIRDVSTFKNAAESASVLSKALDDQRSKYDPLFAAGRQYKDTLIDIRNAMASGNIGQREGTAQIQQTKAAFAEQVRTLRAVEPAAKGAAKAIGLTQYEVLNLNRQVADVVVSLAGGQSPFIVMVQQGAQLMDIFQGMRGSMQGVFAQGISWAGRFVTSAKGVMTGVAGIGIGVASAAMDFKEGTKAIELGMIGVGRRAGATVTDIDKFAASIAKSSNISVKEARSALATFVETGNIYAQNLEGLGNLVAGHAQKIGKSAEEAAQDLAKMFSGDALTALDQLNQKYGFADAALRRHVETLQVAGDKQGAFGAVIKAATPVIQQAADKTGFWTRRLNDLSDIWTGVGKAANMAVGNFALDEQIQQTEQLLKLQTESLAKRQAVATRLREGGASEQMIDIQMPGIGPLTQSVMLLTENLKKLKEEQKAVAEAAKQAQFQALADEADKIVHALIPAIEQVRALTEAINRLKAAQANLQIGGKMKEAGQLQPAIDIGEVTKSQTKTQMENQALAAAVGVELMNTYKTSNVELAKTLDLQRTQLGVASAVGAKAQLEAQQLHRQNELRIQGKSVEEQTKVAAGERAIQQAQLTAAAQLNLQMMEAQRGVAAAVTGEEKIKAQYAATYQQVLLQTNDSVVAAATAAEQEKQARLQVNSAAQNTLLNMKDQLNVASQTTGRQRILAEGQATYNQLVRAGVDSQIASATATTQMETAQAEVSFQVEQQTRSLNDQTAMIYAKLKGTEASVAAEIAYKNAIDAGASSSAAANAADAAYENIKAQKFAQRVEAERKAQDAAIKRQQQANQQVEDQLYNLQKQLDLIGVTNVYTRAEITAQHAYNDAIRQGADSTHAAALQAATLAVEMAKAAEAAAEVARQQSKAAAEKAGGDTSQVGPGGYANFIEMFPGATAAHEKMLKDLQEKGGYSIEDDPNYGLLGVPKQKAIPGLERTIDAAFKAGSTITDQIDRIIAESREPKKFDDVFGSAGKMLATDNYSKLSETAGILKRLVDQLPEGEQIGAVEKQIDVLKRLPETMGRNDLIKQLNDQLEQLRKATEDNTEALQATLDPIFSQGHEYLNSLKIGYYKAARGLTAVVGGYGGTDSQRVVMDLTPGELLQVTPPGQQPAIASNDNSRNVTQNITVNIEGGNTPMDRLTARQRAQGFIKAATMAAG